MEQKIVPMPTEKFCWFREFGSRTRQKVEILERYDNTRCRVRNPETRFYYLAEITRELGRIY